MCESIGTVSISCQQCEQHKTNDKPDGCPGSMGECVKESGKCKDCICPKCASTEKCQPCYNCQAPVKPEDDCHGFVEMGEDGTNAVNELSGN